MLKATSPVTRAIHKDRLWHDFRSRCVLTRSIERSRNRGYLAAVVLTTGPDFYSCLVDLHRPVPGTTKRPLSLERELGALTSVGVIPNRSPSEYSESMDLVGFGSVGAQQLVG